ncbi:MAG: hypothetical protein QF775_00540, partial [archaeon]|nr:hypothetical protein [archaeon]
MFKMSSEEIATPTPEMITTYGMGNIGNDYLINLFIDDRIGRIIDAFRKMDTKNGPNFEVAAPFINDLSFLEAIPRRATEDNERLRPLFYMRLIYDALKAPVLRKPIKQITFPSAVFISVDDSESLAFLGISALLNGFLADKISQFYINPRGGDFNLFGIGPYTSAEKPWLISSRYFPIANTQGRDELKNNILLSNFIDFNSRSIAQTKHALPLSLAQLLSSSSFLWNKEIFGIDPSAVAAMTEEERLQLLLKNKNAIIERCFDYLEEEVGFEKQDNFEFLHGEPSFQQQAIQGKYSLLKIGNQIETSLKEIESMRRVLYHTTAAKKETKISIREISKSFGEHNDTQFEADLLALLEKSPIENLPEAEALEKVVFDLAKKYRREVLMEASYKEKITEETERLKMLRQELEEIYVAMSDAYLKIQGNGVHQTNAILQVHAVFSYFVFNKDVFPEVFFSKMAKKSAAKKIFQFMRGRKKKEVAIEGQALKGTIQDFLNDQSDKIFQQFKGYQEKGVRALTQGEISRITKISRAIENNPQDLEKFERFEKTLQTILIEDKAFSKNCQDLSRGLSTEKIIKLQTHMNACLLFTEGQNAEDATSLKRSLGFQKLHRSIIDAMKEDSIELKALKSGEKILDQLEDFEYPPEVLRSFEENISKVYRSVPLDVIKDFEVNIEPLNIDNFPQVKQKRLVLDELKKKIIEKAPKGESAFLSQKHRPPRTWSENTEVFAGTSIDNLFEDATYTKKYLEKNFGRASFYYGTLLKSLKTFVSRERLNIKVFSPGILKNAFGYMSQEEIDLAILVGIYEEIRKDYLAQIENLERLHITELVRKQSPGSKTTRASVFDGATLFRYYKTQSESFLQNQQTAEQLYELFLPLFLTSYLADAANLKYGSSFFVERKLDTIKKFLPGVERIYGELDAFMISKGQKLAELGAFFREKQHEQDFLEEGFLEKLKDMVNDIVSGPIMMIGESALAAAVIGIGIMSYTGSPLLAVIGGMAISAFWMTKGKVFVKDVFALAKQTIQALLGSDYSPWSFNTYILDLFKVALQTEVKLSQSDRQGQLELQHLFSNAIFLQEEFSIMRNSRYSLLEFKNRLHMLLPNALENVNFSTMLLNLFFKFNEPLFLSMPPDLLKNAQDPHFQEAVKEYGLNYEQLVNQELQKFLSEGHHEEEC